LTIDVTESTEGSESDCKIAPPDNTNSQSPNWERTRQICPEYRNLNHRRKPGAMDRQDGAFLMFLLDYFCVSIYGYKRVCIKFRASMYIYLLILCFTGIYECTCKDERQFQKVTFKKGKLLGSVKLERTVISAALKLGPFLKTLIRDPFNSALNASLKTKPFNSA
jgi:hypothetical protein